MEKEYEIRSVRPCVFIMHLRMVFVRKYRYGVFTKTIVASVWADLAEVHREDDPVQRYASKLAGQEPKKACSAVIWETRLSNYIVWAVYLGR